MPQTDKALVPRWSFIPEFKRLNREFKEQQKRNFDRSHRVCELPPIPDYQGVWISTEGEPKPGTVVSSAATPRAYIVETPTGNVQRNRSQLRVIPSSSDNGQGQEPRPAEAPETAPRRVTTKSQSGSS